MLSLGGKPRLSQLSPCIRTCRLEENHFEGSAWAFRIPGTWERYKRHLWHHTGVQYHSGAPKYVQTAALSRPRQSPCTLWLAGCSHPVSFSTPEALWRRTCLVLFVCLGPSIVGSWTMIGTVACSMNTNVIN